VISYPAAHDLGIVVVAVLSTLLVVGIPCCLYVLVRSRLRPGWLDEPQSGEELLHAWYEIEANRTKR